VARVNAQHPAGPSSSPGPVRATSTLATEATSEGGPPGAGPLRTLSADCYTSPAHHEAERRAIFGREWLLVARSPQLVAPGDYVAVDVCGWPIVVVVDGGRTLRAFHNVCRHRAGPLVWDGAGSCPTFVCRYHGWAYGLDGSLRSARDFGAGADLDSSDMGLLPVAVGTWRGLVFINVDTGARPLAEALAPFAAECASLPIEELTFTHHAVQDIDANWKTYADNYLEGYHIPLVHRELNREIDASRYEVTVGDRYCRHCAPARDGAVNSGVWLWRWPNLALNVYPDAMNIECFWPLGAHQTRVSYSYFFRDVGPSARPANAEVVRISATVLEEDRTICEAVQRNLDAGAYLGGRLSPRHEQGVAAFQRWVREATGRCS